MAASFLHGVEVIETTTGPVPITVVKSSVIGLVGTAPTWAVTSPAVAPPANTPTLVSSALDAANFGPIVQGYTIPYGLAAIQAQGSGQVITINVFNPALHFSDLSSSLTFSPAGAINLGHMGISNLSVLPSTTTAVSGEARTFSAAPATTQLAHGNIKASSVVLTSNPPGTTYVQGTDYSVDAKTGLISGIAFGAIGPNLAVLASYSYYSGTPYSATSDYTLDAVNGVVSLKAGSTIPSGATVTASFSYADPTRVQDSDVIGAVSGATYTGLQGWLTTYGTMGFSQKS